MSNSQPETWLPCHVDERYLISSAGNVKSIGRIVRCGPYPGKRLLSDVQISPFICKSTGYLQIMIARKKYNLHRLVARLFCSGYASDLVVNHKNGNKRDNNADNLEWVTHGQNMRHAFRVLGAKKSWAGKFGVSHPVARQYVATRAITGVERHYPSGTDARKDGFTSDGISHACRDGVKHKGFYWRRVDRSVRR